MLSLGATSGYSFVEIMYFLLSSGNYSTRYSFFLSLKFTSRRTRDNPYRVRIYACILRTPLGLSLSGTHTKPLARVGIFQGWYLTVPASFNFYLTATASKVEVKGKEVYPERTTRILRTVSRKFVPRYGCLIREAKL
jgi:hypothetical protein